MLNLSTQINIHSNGRRSPLRRDIYTKITDGAAAACNIIIDSIKVSEKRWRMGKRGSRGCRAAEEQKKVEAEIVLSTGKHLVGNFLVKFFNPGVTQSFCVSSRHYLVGDIEVEDTFLTET